jgi:hypothetical protein
MPYSLSLYVDEAIIITRFDTTYSEQDCIYKEIIHVNEMFVLKELKWFVSPIVMVG